MGEIRRGVSLYSLQDEYARKTMTLDQMFQELKGMGVQGIEVLTDQMIHGAPHPFPETVFMWKELMERYGFEAVCNDIFINSTLYRNRRLTLKEQEAMLRDEILCAQLLGFPMVRLVSDTNPLLVEPVLALAESCGVTMALEIHGGKSFRTVNTRNFNRIMRQLDSPHVGLILDTGIFCRCMPDIVRQYGLYYGVSPDVVTYIDRIFEEGSDPNQLYGPEDPHDHSQPFAFPDDLKALLKNKGDMQYAIFAAGYENTPFETVEDYLPWVKSIHGKFYEMTPEGVEPAVRFEELITWLGQKDWSGYICSEYEGNRSVLPGSNVDGVGQVRLHQQLLERCIAKKGDSHV